jgi:transcription antitermination factor NusG
MSSERKIPATADLAEESAPVDKEPLLVPPPFPWYALHVRPRYEKQISQNLKQKGFEEFLPLYSSRRKWSDRYKVVEMPLFPGYLFCRIDRNIRMPVLVIPGVIRIVGFGDELTPVSEEEVSAIRSIVKSGYPAEPWPFLKVGQRVRIVEGALEGLEGILIKSKAGSRLVVSVDLLQRSVAVEIDAAWVKPLT